MIWCGWGFCVKDRLFGTTAADAPRAGPELSEMSFEGLHGDRVNQLDPFRFVRWEPLRSFLRTAGTYLVSKPPQRVREVVDVPDQQVVVVLDGDLRLIVRHGPDVPTLPARTCARTCARTRAPVSA